MPPLFWVDIIGLCISVLVTRSLMLMVVAVDPKNPVNRSFGFFTGAMTLWTGTALLLRLSLWIEPVMPPGPFLPNTYLWLTVASVLPALMCISSLMFTATYLNRRTRAIDLAIAFGLLLVILSLARSLVTQGATISDVRLDSNGLIIHQITTSGLVALGVLNLYILGSLVLFRQERHRTGANYLALSLLILLLGLVFRSFVYAPFPILSFSNALSALMLAYGVISTQIFNPLRARTMALSKEMEERREAERALEESLGALRESEEKYRLLAENATDVIWTFSLESMRFTYVSPSVLQMRGYTPQEALEFTLEQTILPESLEQVMKTLQEELAKETEEGVDLKRARTLEVQQRSKDGTYGWAEVTVSFIRNAEGKPVGVLGVTRDISERMRIQKKLLERQDTINAILETSRDWIWAVDHDGIHTYSNPAVETILGITLEELVGQGLLHPEDLELVQSRWPAWVEGKSGWRNLLLRWRHKDGEYRYLESNAVPVLDPDDRLLGFRGVDRDITDRKRAEEETKRLRNYLENIIDSMPSVLVGVDGDGRVTEWNMAAERMTGVKAEEAQGQPLDRVLPIRSGELERLRHAMRDRTVHAAIKVPRVVDGEMRYEDVTMYPLVTNGVEGAVVRVDDVTERVRIEEMMVQSEKMLSVGGLAAGMAHEINNPLGVILQASQNVLRRVSPELPANARVAEECGTTLSAVRGYLEEREIPLFLEDIRRSGERAAGIVSNMLSFSRKAEAGGSSANLCELLDRTQALAESDYDLKKRYDFRRIEILKEYQPDVPPVV